MKEADGQAYVHTVLVIFSSDYGGGGKFKLRKLQQSLRDDDKLIKNLRRKNRQRSNSSAQDQMATVISELHENWVIQLSITWLRNLEK